MAITHTKGTLHGATKDEKLYPKNFSDQVLNNQFQPATVEATDETEKVARDSNGNFVYKVPEIPKVDLTFGTSVPTESSPALRTITVSDGITTDTYSVVGSAVSANVPTSAETPTMESISIDGKTYKIKVTGDIIFEEIPGQN